jgi:hypothetical protein
MSYLTEGDSVESGNCLADRIHYAGGISIDVTLNQRTLAAMVGHAWKT